MIPIPISIATAQQYEWAGNCEGWHLVRAASLSVIEERMPPGTCEVRHWHARARQFFYVLSGTIVMEVEGASTSFPPVSGSNFRRARRIRRATKGRTTRSFW